MIWQGPFDSPQPDGAVGSFGVGLGADEVLGVSDPGFVRCDRRRAEVAEHHASFGQQRLFGSAEDLEIFRIDLGDEDRGAVSRDVVVVGSAPGVGQEQTAVVCQPVRLGVVAPQIIAIVERPFLGRLKVQTVVARRDIGGGVVAQREVVPILKVRQ